MIKEKIISDLSCYLRVDESYINATLESINKKKLCYAQDFRRLVEIGLPIISVLSGVLKIDTTKAFGLIKDGKIPYQDILIILGIIAQDFKLRSQRK
ncbi:MAG: hypothetical protein WCS56_05155 [Bacilli bacterium]